MYGVVLVPVISYLKVSSSILCKIIPERFFKNNMCGCDAKLRQ